MRVGSKPDIATRLKSIHLVLIPAPPPNAGGARVPTFKFDGSELTVGMFYGPSNVKDETFGWVFRNVAYDANVRTRVAMYSHCYAGDTDPCLQASLGQVEQGATVVRAACGAAPVIAVDDVLLREHDKSNISVASLIDGTLAALTSSVCKTPAGKAKFARIKTMRFTYASGAAPKGRSGEPTISFHRQGDDVVVTDYAGTANVDDATTTWAQKESVAASFVTADEQAPPPRAPMCGIALRATPHTASGADARVSLALLVRVTVSVARIAGNAHGGCLLRRITVEEPIESHHDGINSSGVDLGLWRRRGFER